MLLDSQFMMRFHKLLHHLSKECIWILLLCSGTLPSSKHSVFRWRFQSQVKHHLSLFLAFPQACSIPAAFLSISLRCVWSWGMDELGLLSSSFGFYPVFRFANWKPLFSNCVHQQPGIHCAKSCHFIFLFFLSLFLTKDITELSFPIIIPFSLFLAFFPPLCS